MREKGRQDPTDVSGVIYSIPHECSAVYIKETACTLKTRLSEHQQAVINQNSNNDKTVQAMKTQHNILWTEARVLTKEPYLMKRKVKEGLIIRRTKKNTNLDSGYQLDSIWCAKTIPRLSYHNSVTYNDVPQQYNLHV